MDKKLEKMFSVYHHVGGYELLFKTDTFVEQMIEKFDGKIPECYSDAETVLKLIGEAADAETKEYPGIEEKLEKLRGKLESEMRETVEIRDNLAVCGYVLRRMVEPEPIIPMDNEKEAAAITGLIFRNKDNAVVREAVRATVAVLPLRIAKSKFFDIIESVLETKLGETEKDIDDIVSNIEGFAGLKVLGRKYTDDKDACEVVDIVFSKDLCKTESEEINTLYGRYIKASERIAEKLDVLSDIGLMINSLLLELAAAVHIGKGSGEVYTDRTVTSYVKRLLGCFFEGDSRSFEDGLIFEGLDESELEKLEELRIKIPSYEDAFTELAGKESDEVYIGAKRCVTLISDSIFGSLSPEEEAGRSVDRDMISSKAKELRDNFMNAFSSGSKLLQRARMSGVLSKLPLFLSNSDEVKEYVSSSLTLCRDEKEKAVAVREAKAYFKDTI